MFYALKLSDYMGWKYEYFTSETLAIKRFEAENSHKWLTSSRVQLFKMDIIPSNGFPIYPVFVPTHKYVLNKKTFQYEWKKIKRKYELKGTK